MLRGWLALPNLDLAGMYMRYCSPRPLNSPNSNTQELDFHSANGAVQSMRLLLARPADGPYPAPRTRLAVGQQLSTTTTTTTTDPTPSQQSPPRPLSPTATTTVDSSSTADSPSPSLSAPGEPLAVALQPRLLRFGSEIAYEAFYPTPAPPFPLSYTLVVDSLARVLGRVYALLGSPRHAPVVVAQPSVFEAVVRVDALVRFVFFLDGGFLGLWGRWIFGWREVLCPTPP